MNLSVTQRSGPRLEITTALPFVSAADVLIRKKKLSEKYSLPVLMYRRRTRLVLLIHTLDERKANNS